MKRYYSEKTKILELVNCFLKELEIKNINYCHWKSNIDLDLSFTGKGDLDILVDRRQSADFDRLALGLGFKRAIGSNERQFPGIEDYIGWDQTTGILVHLHVHYQLVLGANYTKSIHLPLEKMVLSGRRRDGIVMISSPEAELFVFVLRSVLKIRTYDVIRRRKYPFSVVEELEFLRERVEQSRLNHLLESYPISTNDFKLMIKSIESRSPWALYKVKRKTEKQLNTFQRYNWIKRWTRPLLVRWKYRVLRMFRTSVPGKRSTSGGMIIAAVGSDGSGKSSMVEELDSWLKPLYTVQKYHLGRPPQSVSSYIMLRILGRLKTAIKRLSSRKARSIREMVEILTEYYISGDRVRLYKKIRKFSGNGNIAIVDRHPMGGIKCMDGLSDICEKREFGNFLSEKLVRKIRRRYELFQKPDILLVLKVSLKIASERRPEDSIKYLTERIDAIESLNTQSESVIELDAEKDQNHVFMDAKKFVWSWL